MKRFLVAACLLLFSVPVFADDNIVIVMDTSGSMSDVMKGGKTRLVVAKEALASVLSKIPKSTKVGLLSFGDWIYDLQAVDQKQLSEAIMAIQNGGGTPLYRFTIQGANRLLEERERQGNVGFYKLIVVTDGEADDTDKPLNDDGAFPDGSVKLGALKDIISRGITVDAIGLDMRGDHPLKNQINGQYMRGDDPNSVQESLRKSVAEVGFGDNKDASEDTFAEISELPPIFVKSTLEGLTSFRNYGIGEQPPIEVVENGVVKRIPRPAVVAAKEGWGWTSFILILVVAIIAIVGLIGMMTSDRY